VDKATTWAYTLEGARDATERIKTTYFARDSRGAAEAAFWVSALEGELARPHGGLKPGSAWARACEAEGVRDLLDGLRYVRNHAAHGLAHLAEIGGGITFPLTIPFAIETTMRWQQGDLPSGGSSEPPRLLEAYSAALAGQDVRKTLERAIAWLELQTAAD
jgi:hypothetical protein